MARRKLAGDELSDCANADGYQRGAHRDKDNLRDQRKHAKNQEGSKQSVRSFWHQEEMKEDVLKKGLSVLDEAAVRERVLKKNVEAPDLAAVKSFLRFQAATG